jgi:hypothetical protein
VKVGKETWEEGVKVLTIERIEAPSDSENGDEVDVDWQFFTSILSSNKTESVGWTLSKESPKGVFFIKQSIWGLLFSLFSIWFISVELWRRAFSDVKVVFEFVFSSSKISKIFESSNWNSSLYFL